MIDHEVFQSVATQLMSGDAVDLSGTISPVRRTSSSRLKIVSFTVGGTRYEAIEQNADKPSRWGELARAGHMVVQFKDVVTNRFVAVAVDGEVIEYGSQRTHR